MEPFGAFPEDREVRKSVRGRAGVTRGKFWKIFGLPRRVPVYQKWTDQSSQVSEVSVLRVPVYQNWTDRSSIVREGKNWCVYRSTRNGQTGLRKSAKSFLARVPVQPKVGDRSTQSSEMDFFASTGLRKS